MVSGSWFNVGYIETTSGRKFVGVVGNNSVDLGRQLQIWDVSSDEVNPTFFARLSLTNEYNTNANAAADLYFKENVNGSLTVYQLVTNNGIAAWYVEPSYFTPIWEKSAGAFDFLAADNNTRGMGYNPATDHLLVASRTGGANVYILNAANGDSLGRLDMTGVTGTGATFAINIVRVDASGVIYVNNLALANQTFRIYRWQDETSAPTLAFEGTVTSRTGDSFGLSGSGTSTVLYSSGSGSSVIYRFVTVDGSSFTLDGTIPLTAAGLARGGISPVSSGTNSDLWVNGSGTPVSHIDAAGSIIAQINTGVVSGSWFNVKYIQTSAGNKYVGVVGNAGSDLGKQVQIWDITSDEINPTFYSRAQLSNIWNANANACADLLTRDNGDGTINVYQLVTNNGIAAWQVEFPQPGIPIPWFSTSILNFGNVAIGASFSSDFFIQNIGSGNYQVDSVTFQTSYFVTNLAGGTIIEPDSTFNVSVTFTPLVEGPVQDVMTVYSNAGVHQVTLEGSGYELWPLTWRIQADTAAWMGSTANAPRTMAYSKFSNHLYFVAHPQGVGDFVKVFNATDGEFIRDLDVSALIPGGFISISAIAATEDGQIFASNLASPAGNFNLYKWTTEEDSMHLVFSGPLGSRNGDVLSVSGTGNNVEVYTSGSGSDKIFVLGTTDGMTFTLTDTINLPLADIARYGISRVGLSDYFFVNGPSTAPRYIHRDGTELYVFDTAEVSGTSINYFEVETISGLIRRFISVTNGWHTAPGTQVVELLGPPGNDLCSAISILPVSTPTYSTYTNANATGQSLYNPLENKLIELITNNGVSAYSFDVVVPDWKQPGTPQPILSTTYLNFGKVAVNSTKTLNFSIENQGTADFYVAAVSYQNPYISTTLSPGFILEPDSIRTLSISFTPLLPDTLIDTLWIASNAGNLYIALNGSSYELWPLEWRITADTAAWMGTSANAPRTIAYSKATNHLYFVAHPQGFGDYVKVFDAETGSFIMDMDISAVIPGGFIKINAIAATEDGQIFASNLSSPGGNFNLYRWSDEWAPSQLVFSAPLSDRNGDVLAVSGTGLNVEVYTSGNGGTRIYSFNTSDGNTFSINDTIPLATPDVARFGISRVGTSDYFFVNGPYTAPRYIKRDGTEVFVFDTGAVSGTSINYFEVLTTTDSTRRFISVTNAWHTGLGTKVVELFGEPGDSLCTSFTVLPASTPSYSSFANGNATGQSVYNPLNNSLIELVTNNGVSSYSFEIVVPNDSVIVTDVPEDLQVPRAFAVSQNYPNPFNPTTTILLSIPELSEVKVTVYNILGQKVAEVFNGKLQPGYHKVNFNASHLASGLYFYRVQTEKFNTVKKMMLLK